MLLIELASWSCFNLKKNSRKLKRTLHLTKFVTERTLVSSSWSFLRKVISSDLDFNSCIAQTTGRRIPLKFKAIRGMNEWMKWMSRSRWKWKFREICRHAFLFREWAMPHLNEKSTVDWWASGLFQRMPNLYLLTLVNLIIFLGPGPRPGPGAFLLWRLHGQSNSWALQQCSSAAVPKDSVLKLLLAQNNCNVISRGHKKLAQRWICSEWNFDRILFFH